MNNNTDQQPQQVRISLQLSERCNVLTLGSELLCLIQKLNSGSAQVLKGTIEASHNMCEMKMEYKIDSKSPQFDDIYQNF